MIDPTEGDKKTQQVTLNGEALETGKKEVIFHYVADLLREKADLINSYQYHSEVYLGEVERINVLANIVEGISDYLRVFDDTELALVIYTGVEMLIDPNYASTSWLLTLTSLSNVTDEIGILTYITSVINTLNPDCISALEAYIRTRLDLAVFVSDQHLDPYTEIFDRAAVMSQAAHYGSDKYDSYIDRTELNDKGYPEFFSDESCFDLFKILAQSGNPLENISLLGTMQVSIMALPMRFNQADKLSSSEIYEARRLQILAFSVPMMSILGYYDNLLNRIFQIGEILRDPRGYETAHEWRSRYLVRNPRLLNDFELMDRTRELNFRFADSIRTFIRTEFPKYIPAGINRLISEQRVKTTKSIVFKHRPRRRRVPSYKKVAGLIDNYKSTMKLDHLKPVSFIRHPQELRNSWDRYIKKLILDINGINFFVDTSFFDQNEEGFDNFAQELHTKRGITIIHVDEVYLFQEDPDPIQRPRFYKAYAVVDNYGEPYLMEIRFFNIDDYPDRSINHYLYKAGLLGSDIDLSPRSFLHLVRKIRAQDLKPIPENPTAVIRKILWELDLAQEP